MKLFKHTIVIAEAGVNHNGDLEIAKRIISEAKKAGADVVKFQSFKADEMVVKGANKAKYQLDATSNSESQYEMLKKLELTEKIHEKLQDICRNIDIKFLCAPFDIASIKLLQKLNLEVIKIPSGEINNLPYLVEIGKLKKKVILSTGMSTMDEISDAVNILKFNGSKDIILLHCNTEYPTPMESVNLSAMLTMKTYFDLPVGYSDHTLGIEVPIASVVLGATVLEKHFTLDKNMDGPDHKASLEPDEFKKMVTAIRNVEIAMGDGVKIPSASELKNIEIVRKSIVAKRSINVSEAFTEENITTKRPGNGISPMRWYDLLGQKATKAYQKDEIIKELGHL